MATIHDVAEAAGVSISTVSYALSGKRRISAATQARIDRAIRDLGYRPHAPARMLAGARTQILALSAPMRAGEHLPTHMRFVTSIVETARRHDYDVLLLATDDEVAGIKRVASSSLIDGVVMLNVASDDDRVELVRDLRLPAAFIGVPGDTVGLSCVDLDFAEAGREAVRRLDAMGHKQIGVIGHPISYFERHAGFAQRFADAFDSECAARGLRSAARMPSLDRWSARRAVDELLAVLPGVTAIVFHCNEPIVEWSLRHLIERGVGVPTDISVLAACASYSAADLEVPVDSIDLPLDEMCRLGVEDAMAQVDGSTGRSVRLISPTYTPRGSIAAR